MKAKVEPKNVEAPFNEDEMFFSITDKKGIILSGNPVFVRVSKYDYDELIGKPHNVVRHPDMPRTIFKLFWDYIQNGKPIVAYVKNLTKDGSYYWVLATAFPVYDEEGNIVRYLSIRIKPKSKFFDIVKEIYREIKKVEFVDGIEKGLELLLKRLKELGYKSYDEFMWNVINEELRLKKDILETVINKNQIESNETSEHLFDKYLKLKKIEEIFNNFYLYFDAFLKIGNMIEEKSNDIFSLAGDIRLISLNSSVESYKLGVHGNSFFVLSTEMRKTAEESARTVREMETVVKETVGSINRLTFNMSLSKLAIYMITEFLSEMLCSDCENEHIKYEDLYDLNSVLKRKIQYIYKESKTLDLNFKKIMSMLQKVKILIKRLHFLYLSGMVESAHQVKTSFSIIFSQVNKLVENTKTTIDALHLELQSIYENNKLMKENIESIVEIINNVEDEFLKFTQTLARS